MLSYCVLVLYIYIYGSLRLSTLVEYKIELLIIEHHRARFKRRVDVNGRTAQTHWYCSPNKMASAKTRRNDIYRRTRTLLHEDIFRASRLVEIYMYIYTVVSHKRMQNETKSYVQRARTRSTRSKVNLF